MRYAQLGDSGLTVSVVGLGCNNFRARTSDENAHAVIDAAPEARGSRRYIRQAVRASLRRLRTDWIDLYQYHEPDGVTPVEETLGALDELVREGLVRYVGSSNFAGWQVADAAWTARDRRYTPFVS